MVKPCVCLWKAGLPPFISEYDGLLRGGAAEAVSAYRPLIEATSLQDMTPTGGGSGFLDLSGSTR